MAVRVGRTSAAVVTRVVCIVVGREKCNLLSKPNILVMTSFCVPIESIKMGVSRRRSGWFTSLQ